MVTSDSELIADAAYKSGWYEYPNECQKYLILIMARSQTPFYLTGFKLYKCSLISFTSVSMNNFK